MKTKAPSIINGSNSKLIGTVQLTIVIIKKKKKGAAFAQGIL